MKRFAAMLAIVGFVATTSVAGVVQFEPSNFEYDLTNPPQSIDVQVTVSADSGDWDAVNLVTGSNDGLGFDFTYTGAAQTAFGAFAVAPQAVGLFPSDLFYGGFASAGLTSPFVVGTLHISLPSVAGGLTPGRTFNYFIDSDQDFGFSSISDGANPAEGLAGAGVVTIVPEPATLCLLGLGAIGFIRRRFA